jgi:hypothetical protein
MTTAWHRATEALFGVLVLLAVGYLLLNYLESYLCFMNSCSEPAPGNVLRYRITTAATGLAVVGMLALAVPRRASWAFLWHVPVALTAVAAAVVFAVPQLDVRGALEPEPPEPNPSYVPCYSGPPHDCPGG